MFRLVVIHQLVLSLIVGPMLCCCTTARLGRDVKSDARAATAADHSRTQTCCGHGRTPTEDGPSKPTDPAKCPCNDSPANVSAVPEATTQAADALAVVWLGTAALDLPASLELRPGLTRPAARFAHRSSGLSPDDLLFAHHNLRC